MAMRRKLSHDNDVFFLSLRTTGPEVGCCAIVAPRMAPRVVTRSFARNQKSAGSMDGSLLDPRFSFDLRDGEFFGGGNGLILILLVRRFPNVELRNGVGPFANELRDGDDLLDVRGGGDGDGLSDLRGFDFLDIRARTLERSLGDTTGVRLACWRLSRGPCSVRRASPCLRTSMQAKVHNGQICSWRTKALFELALCFAMSPAGNGCSNTNSDKGGDQPEARFHQSRICATNRFQNSTLACIDGLLFLSFSSTSEA